MYITTFPKSINLYQHNSSYKLITILPPLPEYLCSMKNLLFLLAIATAMAVSSPLTAAYDWRDDVLSQHTIRSTCAKTHLYDFCVEAVNSFPGSYVYKTPFDVALTLIQLLGWHANDMYLNLNRRVGSVNNYRKGSFQDNLFVCRDLYDKMYTVDYYGAYDFLSATNYTAAENRLLLAYKKAQGCEAGFRRIRKIPVMLLKQNTRACQLALVAAGATHSMIGH